jgi:hypothetical protein
LSHHALPTCTCRRLSARRASCGVRMGRGLDTLWWRNEPEKCKTGQIFIILLKSLSKWRQLESNWAMHYRWKTSLTDVLDFKQELLTGSSIMASLASSWHMCCQEMLSTI